MTYASLEDLRDFGVSPGAAKDAKALDALALATEIVEAYTDTAFGPEVVTTKTLPGKYGKDLIVPRPFHTVTAVSVGGVALNSSSYSISEFGLSFGRHYRDADGYLASWPSFGFIGIEPIVPITVTATFGWGEVPASVKRATLILAAHFATQGPGDFFADTLASYSVEGYSQAAYHGNDSKLDTTGTIEVDRLLGRFRQTTGVL